MTDSICTLGIDPGPVDHAWAVVLVEDAGPTLLEFGKSGPPSFVPWECQTVIEMVASYGMPVGKSIFDTVLGIGELCERHAGAKLLTRMEVKRSLCRDSRAKDSNVRQVIIDRFGGPQEKKKGGQLYGVSKDVWAAIAVALAAADPEVSFYERTT